MGKGVPIDTKLIRITQIGRFGELEDVILKRLARNSYASLGELNAAILPDEINKATRAKLSYYVRKLQKQGYVDFDPGKNISLTNLGKARVAPPIDDAPMTLVR